MQRTRATTIGLVALAFVAGLAADRLAVAEAQDAARVYELRTYTTEAGRLPALLERFGGGEIDLFHRAGMTSVGYWVPDDPELSQHTMVYMLVHDSREAAAESWQRFRDDPDWQRMRAESEADGPILVRDGVRSMFLTPTSFSPAR